MDFATSTDPAVQRQLDRLTMLSPGRDILGLERITTLLARLGDPHLALPPVFHVAGTNGKGSTCAFLRAALEAAGYRVHVYTSPHLVRFNERIRLAGALIEDDVLAPLLAEVLRVSEDLQASFFEVTTAAAFLAFSRVPAEACVVEVGLGGRLDATNVFPAPAVCGIAQLGIDHQAFLGERAEQIAAEKAGIARAGVPLVTLSYAPEIARVVAEVAGAAKAPVLSEGRDWSLSVVPAQAGTQESQKPAYPTPGSRPSPGRRGYRDAKGSLALPAPGLPGPHQLLNAGLAAAMLRHQTALPVPDDAILKGIATASWPARLQHLTHGSLVDALRPGTTLLLDGGHNPDAAQALADALAGERLTLILGMLENKDLPGFLSLLAPIVDRLIAVPIPGHDHHAPEAIAQAGATFRIDSVVADNIATALRLVAEPGRHANDAARHPSESWGLPPEMAPYPDTGASFRWHDGDGGRGVGSGVPPSQTVLIAGSLYLAGLALTANGTPPD